MFLMKRQPKKPRPLVVLGMILTRKGGRMRDRRVRRETRRSWKALEENS